MRRPCTADEATDGDDRVGEVEEGFNDAASSFVAACQSVEGVLPGVGAFDMPSPGGLDRCPGPLVRDLAVQSPFTEHGARRGRE